MDSKIIIVIASILIIVLIVVILLTTFPIDLSDFITQIAVGLILGIISLGVCGFKDYFVRKSKSDFRDSDSDDMFLPNYRDRYHEDLKQLIQTVENEIPKTFTRTFFDGLRILHLKEKRLVLQHFYTDENYFHKYFKLYSTYRNFVGFDNDIERDKKKLLDKIDQLQTFLEKSSSKYSKFDMWFDKAKLEEALCLPKSVSELTFICFHTYPNFHKSIPHRLELSKEDRSGESLFKVNHLVIGGTMSNDDFYKISSEITKQLHFISDACGHLDAGRAAVDEWLSHAYSQQVIMAIEPMKRGESIIGVCDGCIEYFNLNQKKKLQKILDKFNDDWSNSEEVTWVAEKEKTSFFSKDH